jgi:uncharacterized protein (DUF302 family)
MKPQMAFDGKERYLMKCSRAAVLLIGVVGLAAGEHGFGYYDGGISMMVSSSSTRVSVEKDEGIVTIPSNHSVDETVDRLKGILQSKGIMIFTLVDHSGEAAKAGLKMPPTKLLIFGNPKAGTPLMLAAPSIAIDLPLKILVSESSAGKVSVSYNSPEYLKQRYGLPDDLLKNIAVVTTLAAQAAE